MGSGWFCCLLAAGGICCCCLGCGSAVDDGCLAVSNVAAVCGRNASVMIGGGMCLLVFFIGRPRVLANQSTK